MIGIIDYGMGNLGSVSKALKYLSVDYFITDKAHELNKADKLILPGVGAFKKAADNLRKYEMFDEIKLQVNKGKPFLGICLGLQLLFNESFEGNKTEGLGILKGKVVRFKNDMGLKVPHIGWNSISTADNKAMLHEFDGEYFYFVHSFFPDVESNVMITSSTYGVEFTSAVEKDNITACQFHPEKSGKAGMRLLRKWADIT